MEQKHSALVQLTERRRVAVEPLPKFAASWVPGHGKRPPGKLASRQRTSRNQLPIPPDENHPASTPISHSPPSGKLARIPGRSRTQACATRAVPSRLSAASGPHTSVSPSCSGQPGAHAPGHAEHEQAILVGEADSLRSPRGRREPLHCEAATRQNLYRESGGSHRRRSSTTVGRGRSDEKPFKLARCRLVPPFALHPESSNVIQYRPPLRQPLDSGRGGLVVFEALTDAPAHLASAGGMHGTRAGRSSVHEWRGRRTALPWGTRAAGGHADGRTMQGVAPWHHHPT